VRFAKITLPFYGYAERLNLRFPSGFLILLDLNVFLEVKKNTARISKSYSSKTIQAWR